MAKKSSSTPKAVTPAASPAPPAKTGAATKRSLKTTAKETPPETNGAAPPPTASEPAAKAPAVKTTKPKAAKPAATKKSAPKSTPVPAVISTEDISLRAYFISEKRRNEGIPGDPHDDWVEAERQLASEATAKPGKKKKAA